MNHENMKVIYVAGPFRAATPWLVEQNIRVAEELALEVWKMGHPAICPHTNARFFSGEASDETWLEGDLAILKRCDAVIFGNGWESSSGSLAELNFAQEHSLPCFFNLSNLYEWLNGKKYPTRT